MDNKITHCVRRFCYQRTHRMLPDIQGGYAACGQDILIAQLLGRKRNGVFVDIGANDGVTISNTLYFEKELNWRGLAVEPIPGIFEKLKANRSCDVVHGCVASTAGKAKFLEVIGNTNMLSTLAVNNVGLTSRRLKKNAQRNQVKINEIEVDCFTLQALVDKFKITEIDFLSVDTEGGELEILQSIDFDRIPVKVVSVENNYYVSTIRKYMESAGFLYVGTFKIDEIYIFGGNELRKEMQKKLIRDISK